MTKFFSSFFNYINVFTLPPRINRMRYLSLTLLYESLVWLVMWFIYLFFSEESTEIFLWILAPVLIYVVQISLMVKRLHDVGNFFMTL